MLFYLNSYFNYIIKINKKKKKKNFFFLKNYKKKKIKK